MVYINPHKPDVPARRPMIQSVTWNAGQQGVESLVRNP